MAQRKRKWPPVEESIERVKQGKIYDFTDDMSLMDFTDEE
jgi:hypothetical protein